MGNIFFEITIILVFAAFLSIIFRMLKQPPILAYILTGILIGPLANINLHSQESITTMGEFGITLLLFMIGLELKLKDLYSVGKTAVVIGVLQMFLTGFCGYLIGIGFGFSTIASFYIGAAMSFSSTIIIVKLVSDKKDLSSLYGKLLVGILLMQDFAAVFFLMVLSGFGETGEGTLSFESILFIILKALILFAVIIYLSKKVFPALTKYVAQSSETLFLFSIAWVFGLAALVSSPLVGFSIEIGGFLAGIALANTIESTQISARVKSLRDFFVTLFFVTLGLQMQIKQMEVVIVPIIVFTYFVLLIKPLIVTTILGFIGYRKRTSFLTGIHAGQISEFSLIVLFLGNKIGHVPSEVITIVTAVGLISFIVSSYLIIHANAVYKVFVPHLWIFERKHAKRENMGVGAEELGDLSGHVILIGVHRMGVSILHALQDIQEKVVVVDFDPDIVELLHKKGTTSVFGDITDLEIQEKIKIGKAKLIISTVPDTEDNLLLLKGLGVKNKKARVIVVAYTPRDAEALYKAGADYVALPHVSSGRQIAKLIKEDNYSQIEKLKERDLRYFDRLQ